nr:hypothetical protein CPGR_00611 [Mycolicibacter nonchromogenicus]
MAAGVAHRDHRITDCHLRGVADVGRRQPLGATQLQHRDVVAAIEPEDVDRVALAVGDRDRGETGGAGDDVVVGQHHAAGVQHDAGPGADRTLVVHLGVDVDHCRADLGGHGRMVERNAGQSGRCLSRGRHQSRSGDRRGHHAEQPPLAGAMRSAHTSYLLQSGAASRLRPGAPRDVPTLNSRNKNAQLTGTANSASRRCTHHGANASGHNSCAQRPWREG